MSDLFEVNLERYSGPYFKLLELIEEKKLSINEFSLSEVTDKYLAHIKEIEESGNKNIIDISKFITVASTLMLIKAKSLFPNINYNEEEQTSIDDLAKKLALYKNMSEASKLINRIYLKNNFISISEKENLEIVFVFDDRVNPTLLHSVAVASLLKVPKKEKLKLVAVKQVLKIEEVIEKLLSRVEDSFKISFIEFSSSYAGKSKSLEEKKSIFIVSFLAMLELIKNGLLNADQAEGQNNIEISKIGRSEALYLQA